MSVVNSEETTLICEQEIFRDPDLKLLICKIHGFGVHPTRQAIIRHLRGPRHVCRGAALKQAVNTLTQLPLNTLENLRQAQPSVESQPVAAPIPHLKVLSGWSCLPCQGLFLTTSRELIQRHAAAEHSRIRGDETLWEPCSIQSYFKETKDRRYFRVMFTGLNHIQRNHIQSTGQTILYRGGNGTVSALTPKGVVAKRKPSRIPIACSRLRKRLFNPEPALIFYHPYTYVAHACIKWLPISRLDRLFKSDSFRSASEPLFDSSHVDAEFNMQHVFPGCYEEPAFVTALLYSIVQLETCGEQSLESTVLQTATINILNDRLAVASPATCIPLLAAIMLLKTTAYKLYDRDTHDIHSQGLIAVLDACDKQKLSVAARRAFFWQDLYATVFVDSSQQTDCTILYPCRDIGIQQHFSSLRKVLPSGFERLRHILTADLTTCITDILVLQASSIALEMYPRSMKYEDLDMMQAWIETRLVHEAKATKFDLLVEGIRLGVFICCYCSWMEIWNDSLIPCTLASKLLELLQHSLNVENFFLLWIEKLDLLLWLLFTASCAVELDQGHVRDLKARCRGLLQRTEDMLQALNPAAIPEALNSALHDFLYFDDWVAKRNRMKAWNDLELAIERSDSSMTGSPVPD